MEEVVIRHAGEAHGFAWTMGIDVSTQTKAAQAVCRQWQEKLVGEYPGRFVREHSVDPQAGNEKIDLVDRLDRTAYELKASPKNTHFEFYRNVFKVMVFNRRNPTAPLRRFVFITPEEGARTLRKRYTDDVRAIALDLGIDICIEGIT